MRFEYYNKINEHPIQEDVVRIIIVARIFSENGINLTFSTTTLIQTFIYVDEKGESKRDLDDFWAKAAGIDEDECGDALIELVFYVCDLNCPLTITIEVKVDISPNHLIDERKEEEEVYEIEETDKIMFRPASKDVVKSLTRKIYKKMIIKKEQDMGEKCAICFEEINNGERFVTLTCRHDFHEDVCVVKWFEMSNLCPLCRYELPCDD